MPSNRSALVAILAAAFAVSGCMSGEGEPAIPKGKISQLVLRHDDLPAAFEVFDEGKLGAADTPPGPRQDTRRFGRIDGYKARYRWTGANDAREPLVVESRADLFEDANGAEQELEAYRTQFGTEAASLATAGEILDEPALGDAAAAMTLLQESALQPVRYYRIAWRHANATASLTVQGFDGRIDLEAALRLARKQQARLEAAGRG